MSESETQERLDMCTHMCGRAAIHTTVEPLRCIAVIYTILKTLR